MGFEVKAKGSRNADGALVAVELEAKPNGSALFEGDVKSMTDQAESEYRKAGRFFNTLEGGRTETVGWMFDSGPKADRARRIVDSLLPPYVDPSQVRVYVIENKEWNAFAMGNYSLYVFSGMMDDLDDDELAIVMGHEIAHATHEHTRRQFKKAMWIQLAALGVAAAAEEIDDKNKRAVAQLLVMFGAQAWSNGYGRDMEGPGPTASACATRTRPATTSPRARACGSVSRRNTASRARSRTSSSATTRSPPPARSTWSGSSRSTIRTARRTAACAWRPRPSTRTASGPGPAPLPPLPGQGHALNASSSTGPRQRGRASRQQEGDPAGHVRERGAHAAGQAQGGGRLRGQEHLDLSGLLGRVRGLQGGRGEVLAEAEFRPSR